jgi:hypothetical protein
VVRISVCGNDPFAPLLSGSKAAQARVADRALFRKCQAGRREGERLYRLPEQNFQTDQVFANPGVAELRLRARHTM